MKNLTFSLSSKLKNYLSPDNGPALDRRWTGHESGRFLSILTLFLTLFSFGVGNVWGAEEQINANSGVYSGSGNSGIHTWTMTSCTVVQAKGTGTAVNSSYPNRWYQNNLITFTPKSGYTISKIELTGSSGSYNGQTMTVTSGGGSLAVSSNKTTWTGTATSAVTIRLGTQFRFGSVKITYSTSASYSVVWTINPAAGGSLSATSGTSTTVTPNSAYTYGDPAYTVTTGSATVSQSTNTFTATPSANCTIRINMVEKPKYTVTYNAGTGTCGTAQWTQPSYGASTTLPTATAPATCTGWSFAGWCTSSAGSADENSTSPGTILTGSYTPTGNVTLYAIYKRTASGGTTTYTLVDDAADFEDGTYVVAGLASSTYYFMDGNATSDGLGVETTGLAVASVSEGSFAATSLPSGAIEIEVEDDEDPDGDNHYYFISYTDGDDTYFMDDEGTKQSLTWTTNTTVWTYHPNFTQNAGTDGCVLLSGSGAKVSQNSSTKTSFIRNYASSGSFYNDIYFFKKSSGTTYYMTSLVCCTNLGSINGSFKWSKELEDIESPNSFNIYLVYFSMSKIFQPLFSVPGCSTIFECVSNCISLFINVCTPTHAKNGNSVYSGITVL